MYGGFFLLMQIKMPVGCIGIKEKEWDIMGIRTRRSRSHERM